MGPTQYPQLLAYGPMASPDIGDLTSRSPVIQTSTACVGHGWQRHAAVGLGRTATSYQGGAGKNSAAAWLKPFWGTDGLVYPEVRMLPLGTFERNSVPNSVKLQLSWLQHTIKGYMWC